MITTYNLVSEALKPVLDFVKAANSSDSYDDGSGKRTTALRLDYESFIDEPVEDWHFKMSSIARDDIMDLVTNGDMDNISDPLLSMFNGEVKRGKRLSYITFPQAAYYREYKDSIQKFEHTLYVVIYVEFFL